MIKKKNYHSTEFGQPLDMDKLWMPMSKPCPGCVKICWGLTDCGPSLDIDWTYPVLLVLGQRLDRGWTKPQKLDFCPDPVQPTIVKEYVPTFLQIYRTACGQFLYLVRHLTEIGKSFDFLSRDCPRFVWPHTNQVYQNGLVFPYFPRIFSLLSTLIRTLDLNIRAMAL